MRSIWKNERIEFVRWILSMCFSSLANMTQTMQLPYLMSKAQGWTVIGDCFVLEGRSSDFYNYIPEYCHASSIFTETWLVNCYSFCQTLTTLMLTTDFSNSRGWWSRPTGLMDAQFPNRSNFTIYKVAKYLSKCSRHNSSLDQWYVLFCLFSRL